MINIQQFKALQKKTSDSFHQQKKLIKNIMLGKNVYCRQCQEILQVKFTKEATIAHVCCTKGCTDIELELD
jgi:ATP sulfurylase